MFIETLKKILDLFSYKERGTAYLLFAMILVMALLDMTGVASITPLLAVLANPEVVETNVYLAAMYEYLGFSDRRSFLYFLGVAAFVLLVVSVTFKGITIYCILRFTHMRNYSLSKRLVKGYLNQPYEWFLDRHSADLGKTVLSEVEQVTQGAMIPMMQLVAQGSVVVALVSLLILVNPWLAVIIAITLGCAYALIYVILRKYLLHIGEDRVVANKERFASVQEAFGGIKDVKIGALESEFIGRFKGPARRYAEHQAASQAVSYLPRYLLEVVAFGGMIVVMLSLMADADGLHEVLPLIGLYAFAGYRLLPALQQVYAQLVNLRYSKPALDALHADLQVLRDSDDRNGGSTSAKSMKFRHHIQLQNVSYRYPKAENSSLSNLCLKVEANTTVGIVGSSGSGKTTTADIILGLLSPATGNLLVDGIVIHPGNVRSWQRCIGYVPQQIYLSDASVASNIAFGLTGDQIDTEAVEEAARIANLHQFVTTELSEGYKTAVGERGVRLSGGQRQRIGIARALYHRPELLIFDEATSALDNITEQVVMEAVHNLSHQKTIIIIAHRLSTVRPCDDIYLLERGQVEARGTYKDLVSENERFSIMAKGEA
ncbi:ABC transporter ATP-binding protein [Haliea sp. E1-2-M8]|uniref:ABC transporter ATP-binding protein n=1 Tax=Haliea sp. E1-2-M8 TaxID=3064706 RepID=UPI0027261830|nr:ABC transporter ATP-binding protein [Haliea sp. E1-2-M8]MDO8861658.1 ABC transporter ATP-binding protein [Haliea sp. E1-2-M8]